MPVTPSGMLSPHPSVGGLSRFGQHCHHSVRAAWRPRWPRQLGSSLEMAPARTSLWLAVGLALLSPSVDPFITPRLPLASEN